MFAQSIVKSLQQNQMERRAPKPEHYGEIELASGIKIEKISSGDYIDIRFTGRKADNELVDTVMLEIQRLLESD